MHVFHGVVCRVLMYVHDAHYMYVHMVEEKILGDFRVWKLMQSAYRIKTKVNDKDELKDNYRNFVSVLLYM